MQIRRCGGCRAFGSRGVTPEPAALCVFARPPIFGEVKRRLARELGADEALRIYRQLAEGTLSRLHAVPGLRTLLWAADQPAHAELRRWSARWHVPVRAQCPGDLGRRMDHALRQSLVEHRCALVVGVDIPPLTAAYVAAAAQALADADLVLGPVVDGGYGLVGVRAPQPALFRGIPWGTGEVLQATLDAAHGSGLRTVLLEPLWDLDTADDWRRFRDARS